MNSNGYRDNGYDHENRDADLVAVLGGAILVAAAGCFIAGWFWAHFL